MKAPGVRFGVKTAKHKKYPRADIYVAIYVNPDAFFSQMNHRIYDPHANRGVQGGGAPLAGVWGRSPQLAFTTIYHQRGSGGGAPSKL